MYFLPKKTGYSGYSDAAKGGRFGQLLTGGCSTNTSIIHWLIQWWFVKISVQPRHTPMVEDNAFSHNSVTIFKEILNLEGHPNRITGLKVTAILLNGWRLQIGGVLAVRVCVCSLHSRPCPKAPLVMKQLLPPIFLFHLVQSFRFFFDIFFYLFFCYG